MKLELFQPTPEAEARLLLLINAFTGPTKSLEGRTKLAKLDFLLRYPRYFEEALRIRSPRVAWPIPDSEQPAIENRMIRYRYGPWDPAYFTLLGRLIGRGLVRPVPTRHGIGYRTTGEGRALASSVGATAPWADTQAMTVLLRRHFDLSGRSLKNFVYEHFPEVTAAAWGQRL